MKNVVVTLVMLTVSFFGLSVFADDIAQLPAWQVQLDALTKQMSSPWVGAIALLVIEFVMRLVKTNDPKSLLYIVSNGFKMVAKVLDVLSQFLDQYIQRLKQ